MNQTVSQLPIQPFLAQIAPFESLGTNALQAVAAKCQVVRYRIGQQILVREKMPAFVRIISQGQVRLLGYDQRTQMTVSLQLAGPGEILGACSLVRGVPTEIAIASTEVVSITLAAKDFLTLVAAEASFGRAFRDSCALSEVFELLSVELQRRADGTANIKELAFQVWQDAIVFNLTKGKNVDVTQLDSNRVWLVSGGEVANFPVGSRLPLNESYQALRLERRQGVRLLGLNLKSEVTKHKDEFIHPSNLLTLPFGESSNGKILHPSNEIPYAPDHPPDPYTPRPKYPYVRGRGPIDAPLACFQMLSQHLGVSFRRDLIRKVLENQLKTADSVSLQICGAVSEMMGLRAQLVQVPASAVNRLKAPVLIHYCDSFAIIYSITERELVMAVPEVGILRKKPGDFAEIWGTKGQVLLLQPSINKLEEKFSLRWFLPSIYRYRKVLAEVLIASLFVQLFALANPIITQVIIDKVLVQHSIDTLDVLGIFLLGVAFFEALLTSLRTYLFVDTTNRIDLNLGSEVIDHLLRLPLKYFERRRIGELADRINELENIRKFLTGTVLTVVLDAVFSVIYVAVMLVYSWLLTLVALVTVPLFALLTIFVSPIVRQQLRKKAERHADTQSYLVEVLSGIQTVKAQNIEMKSRWQWQERYAK